jgi:tetratricopeptide (TPR) repeat protein
VGRGFSSAWLALAQLKLGQPDKARRVLDRVFKEAPARLYKTSVYAIPYAQIARAEVHLIAGHHNEALSILRQALAASERGAFRLEEVAAHRVLGQVHEAMGDRAEAEAAFRRSLEVCEKMQCPPELAQTLLAYGRFRRGDKDESYRMDQGGARRLGGCIAGVICTYISELSRSRLRVRKRPLRGYSRQALSRILS